jgi:hypothetical protein
MRYGRLWSKEAWKAKMCMVAKVRPPHLPVAGRDFGLGIVVEADKYDFEHYDPLKTIYVRN